MRSIKAIIFRNLTAFTRDRLKLIFSIIMPLLFLFIFSFTMKAGNVGIAQPINYLLSGIIIMTVFQTALNSSMNIIEDIASGFMKEVMVAPIPRWQISIGQVISSMIISVIQGLIVVVVGFFMGFKMDLLHGVGMLGVMMLVGFTFSSIGLFLATLTKSSSTFQVMVSVIVLPLTLLSGALIPTTVMPLFLKPLFFFNPLTYTTSIFRWLALQMENLSVQDLLQQGVAFQLGSLVITPLGSLIIIIMMNIVFFILCIYRFNHADFSAVKTFRHGRVKH